MRHPTPRLGKTRSPRRAPPSTVVRPLHRIVIECRDEADQRIVYERMVSEGRKCRVLTL